MNKNIKYLLGGGAIFVVGWTINKMVKSTKNYKHAHNEGYKCGKCINGFAECISKNSDPNLGDNTMDIRCGVFPNFLTNNV
jgi:hypothetical protein